MIHAYVICHRIVILRNFGVAKNLHMDIVSYFKYKKIRVTQSRGHVMLSRGKGPQLFFYIGYKRTCYR